MAIAAPIIEGDDAGGRVDLSGIDFEKLAKLFASRPKTAAEKLRETTEAKAHEMAARNPTRVHLVDKLEKLVDTYNLGTLGVEAFFEALKELVAEMEEEERRAAREGLTEDELTIFDLLTRPEPKLTKAQEVEVKKVARDLLEKLHDHLSVSHWQARPANSRDGAAAPSASRSTSCRRTLTRSSWNQKVDAVWAYCSVEIKKPRRALNWADAGGLVWFIGASSFPSHLRLHGREASEIAFLSGTHRATAAASEVIDGRRLRRFQSTAEMYRPRPSSAGSCPDVAPELHQRS